MLSEHLKTNTQQAHQELETIIIHKIKQLSSKADYVHFLKVFYGYIAVVEDKLTAIVDTEVIADYFDRRKAENILNDISVISPQVSNIPLATNTPEINSLEQALGTMYVLEGSTLGGKYISRMIASKLQLKDEALSYFNGYQDKTEEMWQKFKDLLNNISSFEIDQKIVSDTANQTFIKFKKWIDEHY